MIPYPDIGTLLRLFGLACLLALPIRGCGPGDARLPDRALIRFQCEEGIAFAVLYGSGTARIFTSAGLYDLTRIPSSIGARYRSETVAFIHDQDRAVLVGAQGGPFRSCHESGPRG
jgi:hypothetical protein